MKMIKQALTIVTILSSVLLTGCYSIETGNPIRENDQVLDEMLGEWDVVDTSLETDNTSEVPIIPILETYKRWKIEYSDHRGKERSFVLDNKVNGILSILFELHNNMEDILKDEIIRLSPDFDMKVYFVLSDPYFRSNNFSRELDFEEFFEKHKKMYSVKDFKFANYFKDNVAYIQIRHDCGSLAETSSEESNIQCKKEIDEFVQKISNFNGVISVYLNRNDVEYYYLQGKEVPMEILESQNGESNLDKYESLLRDSFPDLKVPLNHKNS